MDVSSENLYPNCDIDVWLRSCDEETVEPITGTITGTIPRWLQGSLIRNGPGYFKVGNENFKHYFDGSAVLHRFCIEDGTVTYQCRFLQSEVLKRNRAANRIVVSEFGTRGVPDPCSTIFHKVASIFSPKSEDISDNSMISVYPFDDEVYAFGELPVIHRINKESLKTEDRVDLRNFLSIVHHSSHPHVTDDGSVYNLALSIHPTGPHHTIVKFPTTKNDKWHKTVNCTTSSNNTFTQASIVAHFPARWRFKPSYMHSFGVTENYFVIVEQPLNVSIGRVITSKLKNKPFAACFQWHQHEKVQFSLVSRKTGVVTHRFYSEAFCYLHIINQYEIFDHVVIDICTYQDAAPLECMYIDMMKNMQQNPNYADMFRSTPLRFVLPLKPKKANLNLVQLTDTTAEASYLLKGKILVKPEQLVDVGCETPKINYEQYSGKPYRYFYAISTDIDTPNFGNIIKVDTVTKTWKSWQEKNCYPSEPVFVPRPNPQFEDDGVVLASLLWGKETNKIGLLVLDAVTLEELGRCEFQTLGTVPKCLHGHFFPKK